MRIFLDARSMRSIKQSIADALEEGDISSLRDELVEMFSDDQVDEIERRLDTDDFLDFLDQIIDEWTEEDADELIEMLAERLGEIGIDLNADPEDEDVEEDDSIDDDDLTEEAFDDDEDEDEF